MKLTFTARHVRPTFCAVMTASLFLGIDAKVGPIVLRPFDGLWLVAMTGLAFRAAQISTLPRISHSMSLTLFAAFLIYSGLNGLFQTSLAVGVKELIQGFQFLTLFYYLSASLADDQSRQQFLRTFYGLIAVIVLATTAVHLSQGIYAGYKELDEPKLVYGLVALFAFVTYLFGPKERKYAGPVLLIAIALMLLSGERKGWAAMMGASGLLLLLGSQELTRRVIALRALALMAFALLAIPLVFALAPHVAYVEKQLASFNDIFSYFQEGDAYSYDIAETISTRMRLYLFEKSLEIYHANPVFGIGPEGFKPFIQSVSYHLPSKFVKAAHNEYLRIAAETGTVGLALYILCWLSILYDAIGFVRRRRELPPDARLQVWLILGLAAYGAIINAFLAGGALNLIFLVLPAALLVAARTAKTNEMRRPASVSPHAGSLTGAPIR